MDKAFVWRIGPICIFNVIFVQNLPEHSITVKKLLILFLLIMHGLFASAEDTLRNSNKVFPLKYYTVNQFEYKDSVNYIDNSLLGFQNYLPLNTLGNTGLPFNDFIYKTARPFGFNYQKNFYQPYFYSPLALNFYNTRIPYTDLLAVFGSKKEQYFNLVFSYNIKKNWNMTANFSRIKSVGFYQKQRTDHTFLELSSNYRSLNNRYMLLASAGFNTIKNQENGGMANDSAFYKGNSNYGPALSDAQNYRFNKNMFVKQYLNFGYRVHDTTPIIPTSRFILTSAFDDFALKYLDANAPKEFYKNSYIDPLKSHDSVYLMKIENELAWKRVDNLKHRGVIDMIGVGAGLKHQYVNIKQDSTDKITHNILASAELKNLYSNNKFWWSLNGAYGFTGYNKNDYDISAFFSKGWKDTLRRINVVFRTKAYAPDLMYNVYTSNHFKWFNSDKFVKTKEQTISASLNIPKYDLLFGMDLTNYTDVIYFDTLAIVRQYRGTIPVLSASIKKNFTLYNWHLNNKIQYQQVPDSSVIRVPQFILQHSLYYENNLFKKALRLQIGFQLFYNTAYYANAYMPATAQFYMQNDSKYGNYPVIDFFLNLKIKVVNIFFKVDHLNAGLSGNDYILTPHYILNQRAFKFGASWKFWD